MVSVRQFLHAAATAAAVAGATATGGPIVGAEVAAFMASPAGKKVTNGVIDQLASNRGIALEDLATGGLVMGPTLGFTGEAGPEMVIPLSGPMSMQNMMKPKRKASTYNRKYAAAYKRIKKKKTLKSGKMAKGFSGKSGHKKIVKMAHAEVKRSMNRRKR